MKAAFYLIPAISILVTGLMSCEQTDNGCVGEAPQPDVTVTSTTIHPGDSVTFTYAGTAGDPAHLRWSFPGGTPLTAEDVNPVTVVYSSLGTYDVDITATNGCGEAFKQKPALIKVVPKIDSTIYTIYFKDFIPDTVIINPYDEGAITFTLDIDNNGIPDITFQDYMSSFMGLIYSNLHALGTDSLWFIQEWPLYSGCYVPIDSLGYVSLQNVVGQDITLKIIDMENGLWCEPMIIMRYLGFTLIKNNVRYLGWIRMKTDISVITIDSYATLLCPFDSVQAGYH